MGVPLLRHVVGVSTEVHIHPDTAALAKSNQGLCLWPTTQALRHQRAVRRQPHPHCVFEQGQHPKVPLLGKSTSWLGPFLSSVATDLVRQGQTLTQTLKNGRSVLVFPEGTRSADGSLKPFKKGAFHLAAAAGTCGAHAHLRHPQPPAPICVGIQNPTRPWLFGLATTGLQSSRRGGHHGRSPICRFGIEHSGVTRLESFTDGLCGRPDHGGLAHHRPPPCWDAQARRACG